MTEIVLDQRVDRLEGLMAALARESQRTVKALRTLEAAADRKMDKFQAEMAASREEARRADAAFYARMDASREESRRAEAAFRKERRLAEAAYEAKREADRREWRQAWGDLSNRLGTMAEDLVAPSIPRVLRSTVGCPEEGISSIAVRVGRRSLYNPGHMRAFDVVATCGEYLLVNETKSKLTAEHIAAFAALLPDVRHYFPEHLDKQVIGAIASLYVDESLVRFGERQGLIVLGFGEDVMDVLNTPGFKPRTF
jgi:hypothetical protein